MEDVVACTRAAVRWLKKPPQHHHADRHRKAWAAAKTLSTSDACVVAVARTGFSLRGGPDVHIPLARITRWGHDARDFFVEAAAADASAVAEAVEKRAASKAVRGDGVIRIVVATREGARLAAALRNHAIWALRAIQTAAAASGPRVSRRRSAVEEALIAAASPVKPSRVDGATVHEPLPAAPARQEPRGDNARAATAAQARWRGARLRTAWRREESALVLQGNWRGCAARRVVRE